jgi:glycosyltransferase involved in cell wall biosynthesis
VATEGPIGVLTRRACLRRGRAFTTSYHTRFPEYIEARAPIPERLSYRWLRSFHNAGHGVMVSTPAMERELAQRGFLRIMRWSRGVDHHLFRPRGTSVLDLPRPIHLFVGRVAIEKNIEAFLALDLPGSQVVIGDGPQFAELRRRFPNAHFLGKKVGEDLARHYAAADVFVFPSLTDTFGLVILEALASGVPVAAYPVPGPRDILQGSGAGVLSEDLGAAVKQALALPGAQCRAVAERFSWKAATEQFLGNLAPFGSAQFS